MLEVATEEAESGVSLLCVRCMCTCMYDFIILAAKNFYDNKSCAFDVTGRKQTYDIISCAHAFKLVLSFPVYYVGKIIGKKEKHEKECHFSPVQPLLTKMLVCIK